jgi:hypothetical protein
MGFSRTAYVLILAAVVLTGLARISILPPFEGADETAHYSRILSVAFPPARAADASFIAREAYDYYGVSPMSEGWVNNAPMHAQDPRAHGGKGPTGAFMTYHDFFTTAGPPAAYRRAAAIPAARTFTPSPDINWQFQHPPAYYLLLGWVCRHLPEGQTLQGRLTALRVFGFLAAMTGFAAGIEAMRRQIARRGGMDAGAVAAFGAFYPFMMPSFFNDVTRLGNDTLALCAFGVIWTLLLRHLRRPGWKPVWVLLGLAMAGGLLVKATLMPPVLGLVLCLAWHHAGKDGEGWRPIAVIFSLAVLPAAAWYAPHYAEYRGVSGMAVFGRAVLAGQAVPWMRVFAFAIESLMGAVLHLSDWVTFFYGWPAKLAMALPALVAAVAWGADALRRRDLFTTLPVWSIAPLLGAVTLHSVFSALSNGPDVAPTPAYYAHVLGPAFALCFGMGLICLRDGRLFGGTRDVVAVLGLWAVISTLNFFWRQVTMYGDCWWDDRKTEKHLFGACMTDLPLLFRRLEVLGAPQAGIIFIIFALICVAAGFALAVTGWTERAVPIDSFPKKS